MKTVLNIAILIVLVACSSTKKTSRNSADVKRATVENDTFNIYNYLDILPHAFEVNHSSDVVREYTEHLKNWPYKWHFQTSVKNISKKELKIVSFGILAWDKGRWKIDKTQEKYNSGILGPEDFSNWYNCPTGVIKPGETFSDSTNWSGSYRPEPFMQKWFYLGKDKKGNYYIGESEIRFEN